MFNCRIEEITDNSALSSMDVQRMTYYIRQTFERYALMIAHGYLTAEEAFRDPQGDDTFVKPFDNESAEDRKYVDCKLGHNLELMRTFCWENVSPIEFLESHGITDGVTSGGFNDFLFETLPPCLAFQSLNEAGVMETLYGSKKALHLLIHFFAKLKMVYGRLDGDGIPPLDMVWDHLDSLGVHAEYFSFRELTLLSGYKTERGIRNLASPSTPAHRRIKVIKEGRRTLIEPSEAKRWLSANKGDK